MRETEAQAPGVLVPVLTWVGHGGLWLAAIEHHPEILACGADEDLAMARALEAYARARPMGVNGIVGH